VDGQGWMEQAGEARSSNSIGAVLGFRGERAKAATYLRVMRVIARVSPKGCDPRIYAVSCLVMYIYVVNIVRLPRGPQLSITEVFRNALRYG